MADTPSREAFRRECLSLAAQLELYAKMEGILPGVTAAMQESAAALRLAAKPSGEGVREAAEHVVKVWQEAPYGVSFGRFMDRACGTLAAALSPSGEQKP